MPVSPRQIGGAAGKHDLIALNRIAAILDLTAIKGAFKSTGSDFGDDEFRLAPKALASASAATAPNLKFILIFPDDNRPTPVLPEPFVASQLNAGKVQGWGAKSASRRLWWARARRRA